MEEVKVPYLDSFKNFQIIDSHVHLSQPYSIKESEDFYRTILEERQYAGMVFVAYTESGSKGFHPNANMEALHYKRTFPGCWALGSLLHTHGRHDTAEGYLEQAKTIHALGFDGMKMLEGKPDLYKVMGRGIDDPIYDQYYAYLEENGIPVTMHVADPASFWDADKVSEYAKKVGWFYGDPSYPTREKLFSEIWNLMHKFPLLKLNLAHFGNFPDSKERAEEFLGRWKNTRLDLTPGGYMFRCFSDDPAYWKDFFHRYSTRILFGTDTYNLPEEHVNQGGPTGRWALVRTFLEKTEPFEWFTVEGTLIPFGFDDVMLKKLYCDNARELFGAVPRSIDSELVGWKLARG